MQSLITTVKYIVYRSIDLKDHFTDEVYAPVDFTCIFCQSDEEYRYFNAIVDEIGKIVEDTPTGYTYCLDKQIETPGGDLRLVKIRIPDEKLPMRGDTEFAIDYSRFKEKYGENSMFELVEKDTIKMMRLYDPFYDVVACFTNTPKTKHLGIAQ